MNTKDFITGGHFKKKGYRYRLYFVLPEFKRNTCESIVGSPQKSIKVSFPSVFLLTQNNLYSNITLTVFGFGMGLEIQSKT